MRIELEMAENIASEPIPENFLDLNEALEELELSDPEAAEIVKLRFFVGLTIRQIAETLDMSARKADYVWAFAKSWLYEKLKK